MNAPLDAFMADIARRARESTPEALAAKRAFAAEQDAAQRAEDRAERAIVRQQKALSAEKPERGA